MFRKKVAISFLVIGAQKAGTSSLHNFLSNHPNIIPSYPKKEIDFFSNDLLFSRG